MATKDLGQNELQKLSEEFFRNYNPDYWLYKIALLRSCHDSYDTLKAVFAKELPEEEIKDENYKRVIRTELHFLYFQMTETLFEIIFAMSRHDNRNIWLALTLSNKRDSDYYSNTYEQIAQLAPDSDIFVKKLKVQINGEETEISLLRWIFYFIYPSKMSDSDWLKNLGNIKALLLLFARNFSDRNEYNAYKHSLRFYNSGFSMTISKGNEPARVIGESKDSITYLDTKEYTDAQKLVIVTKLFSFSRDYDLCVIIHAMIKNIILSRKYALLPELKNTEWQFTTFVDVNVPALSFPNTGVIRFSQTL